MKVSEAVVEYLRTDIIPHIAGESELTAAILNGALKAGRKRIAEKIGNIELLSALQVVDQQGNADREVVKDFVDGMFDGRDKISVTLAEIVKAVTGVDSNSQLLADKISFNRSDADKFIALLEQ